MATIAQRIKFRIKSVHGAAASRRRRGTCVALPAVSEMVAARLLVAYHLAHQRPMMGGFLDALGITHEDGLIADEEMKPPAAEKLREAAAAHRRGVSRRRRRALPLDADLAGPGDLGRARRRCPNSRSTREARTMSGWLSQDWAGRTAPRAGSPSLTLTVLEIVLGIDNIVFISILAGKLRAGGARARAEDRACRWRCSSASLLLLSITWVMGLTAPLFTVLGHEISGRDLILLVGGLFLIAKSTHEIHEKLEGDEGHGAAQVAASFAGVIVQILLLDIVFSLDSVITAVGMAEDVAVMIAGGGHRRRRDAGLVGRDQRVRRAAPDGEDAGAQLPAADRRVADRRGLRPAHPEGLHLLRDGLLGVRRDDQPARAREGEPVHLHQPYKE